MVTTKSKGDFFDLCYLDTGCSTHMTGRKEWFIKSKVKFGGNSVVIAEGVCKVMIKSNNGVKACITDVLYVPKLKNNLLCLEQLVEKGYFFQSTIELNEGI